MTERFEYAPEVLEWLRQLNRRALLGRYPAWKDPDGPPREPDDGVRSVSTAARET